MNSTAEVCTIFTNTSFGTRTRAVITECYCGNLTDLAILLKNYLDKDIRNCHKLMANIVATIQVQLNESHFCIICSMCLHFTDQVQYTYKCGYH